MPPSPKFLGRVVNGELRHETPVDYDRHLASLEGKRVELDVKVHRSQRSTAQNRWLWGPGYTALLNAILEEQGYDHHERTEDLKEQLHEELLKQRFGTKTVPSLTGGPPVSVPNCRSSKLNTKEFADFMEWLVRYAATTYGVVLELPDDLPPLAADEE